MNLIFLMVPTTLLIVFIFVWMYYWAHKEHQFEDLESPAQRILFDESNFENLKNIKITSERTNHNE